MHELMEVRIGPFHAASLLIVLGLIVADARWTLLVYRRALSQRTDRPPGFALGLAVGVWFRSVLVAIVGVMTLFGYLVAFGLFAAGVAWRALPPGREFATGVLAGFEESTGRSAPGLASFLGAAWMGITRGIPLVLLYSFMPAA